MRGNDNIIQVGLAKQRHEEGVGVGGACSGNTSPPQVSSPQAPNRLVPPSSTGSIPLTHHALLTSWRRCRRLPEHLLLHEGLIAAGKGASACLSGR